MLRQGLRLLALATALPVCAEEPPVFRPRYRIEVRCRPEANLLEGTVHVEAINTSGVPVDRIAAFAYPNLFDHRNPGLNDANWFRYYPGSFDPGWMEIGSVNTAVADDRPQAAEWTFEQPEGLPRNTFGFARLPRPAQPGEIIRAQMIFSTKLPHRYGPFGYDESRLYAQGGWHPFLADLAPEGHWMPHRSPPPADWTIEGDDAYWRYWMAGDGAPLPGGSWRWEASGLRSVSLHAADFWNLSERTIEGMDVRFLQPADDPKRAEEIWKALEPALRFLVEAMQPLGDLPPQPLTIVESPMRDDVTLVADRVLWVSDRALKVAPVDWLMNFHRVSVVRGVYALFFQRWISGFESPDRWDETAEGLSWFWTRQFLEQEAREAPDARDMLGWFKFIPQVDQLIYAPKVPFVYSYFRTIYETDPFRHQLDRFNHRRPTGKAIFERLADFMGPDWTQVMLQAYLAFADTPLEELSQAMAAMWQSGIETTQPEELERFWAQLEGGLPKVNYAVGEVECRRESVGWASRVEILREGPSSDWYEPITVQMIDAEGKSHQRAVRAAGWAREYIEHQGTSCIETVRIDPEHRLYEDLPHSNDDLRLDNTNRSPYKLLVENIANFAADLGSGDLITSIGMRVSRERDLKNAARFRFFLDQQSDGLAVSMVRNFGRKVDPNTLTYTLEGGYLIEKLDTGFSEELGRKRDFSQGWFAAFKRNPKYYDLYTMRDTVFRARTEQAGRWMGSDLGYSIYWAEAIAYWAPVETTLLTGRVQSGHLSGTVPVQKRFSAGGRAQMRGLAVDDFLGDDLVLFSGEAARMLVSNLDWGLRATRITGWQAVVFGDAGRVADGYGALWRQDRFLGDVGAGLRMFVEYAGVRPAMIALDVAWRINGESLDAPRFHVAFDPSYFFFD